MHKVYLGLGSNMGDSVANIEQAVERAGSKSGNKGWDAAMVAIEMAQLIKKL